METVFIAREEDFRRWVSEAVKEAIQSLNIQTDKAVSPDSEPLLSRKEVAAIFNVSLVTLHSWMKRGLPSHKQQGRVYFLRSEVMGHLKKDRPDSF